MEWIYPSILSLTYYLNKLCSILRLFSSTYVMGFDPRSGKGSGSPVGEFGLVLGNRKEVDDLHSEELWMKRIEILENQYDQHLNQLQKKLLSTKINKRVITSLQTENLLLKTNLKVNEVRSGDLQQKVQGLQSTLQAKEAKELQLKRELKARNETLKSQSLDKKRAEELATKAAREKELAKQRLLIGQKDHERLATKVKGQELELVNARNEIKAIGTQSQALAHSLKKSEEEKRKLEKEVSTISEAKAFQRRESETAEERLRRLKADLDEILKQLGTEQKHTSDLVRERRLREKHLVALRDELKQTLSNAKQVALETKYWKDEAEILLKVAEAPPRILPTTQSKIKDRQNHRCGQAAVTYRLNLLERKLAQMENEKISLKNQMKSVLTLHKSLIRLYQSNLMKRQAFEDKMKQDGGGGSNDSGIPYYSKRTKVSSIPSKIGSNYVLEKHSKKLNVLESELFRSRRAYNFLKFKLQQKSELERNLSLAEVNLFRAEREKRQCEAIGNLTARKRGFGSGYSRIGPGTSIVGAGSGSAGVGFEIAGTGSRMADYSLTKSLMAHIKHIQSLRERLPPLIPRNLPTNGGYEPKFPNVAGADLDGNLPQIREDLRRLERKQAVYTNIQAAKDRLAEEKQRLLESKNVEQESESEVTESSDTDEEQPEEDSSTESEKSESRAEVECEVVAEAENKANEPGIPPVESQ